MVSTYPQNRNVDYRTGSQTFERTPQKWVPSQELREAFRRTEGNRLIREAEKQRQLNLNEHATRNTGPKIPVEVFRAARVLFRLHPAWRIIDVIDLSYRLWKLQQDMTQRTVDQSGWQLCGVCSSPPWVILLDKVWTYSSGPPTLQCNWANGCLDGQADVSPAVPPTARGRYLMQRYRPTPTALPRRGWLEAYTRPTAVVPQDPFLVWDRLDWGPAPAFARDIHPTYLPIMKPAPDPNPLPHDMIPERGPDPLDNSDRGNEEPSPDPDFVPNAKAGTQTSPFLIRPHTTRPTRFGERERKFQGTSQSVQMFFSAISNVKESLTEYKDFLEDVVKSMPKEYQKVAKKNQYESIYDLSLHIYKHYDKIDGYQLWENVVKNWLEDKAVGAAIQASDKAARKLGLSSNLSNRGAWLQRPRTPPRW